MTEVSFTQMKDGTQADYQMLVNLRLTTFEACLIEF